MERIEEFERSNLHQRREEEMEELPWRTTCSCSWRTNRWRREKKKAMEAGRGESSRRERKAGRIKP